MPSLLYLCLVKHLPALGSCTPATLECTELTLLPHCGASTYAYVSNWPLDSFWFILSGLQTSAQCHLLQMNPFSGNLHCLVHTLSAFPCITSLHIVIFYAPGFWDRMFYAFHMLTSKVPCSAWHVENIQQAVVEWVDKGTRRRKEKWGRILMII